MYSNWYPSTVTFNSWKLYFLDQWGFASMADAPQIFILYITKPTLVSVLFFVVIRLINFKHMTDLDKGENNVINASDKGIILHHALPLAPSSPLHHLATSLT